MGGTHEVFALPITNFKTIRPRPQDTCRLVPGMQHVFAMKQYLPEGQQARKQIAQFIQKWDRSQNDFCPTCLLEQNT